MEIIPGRKIDEIAYMNLTEVVGYENRIEKMADLYSNFTTEEVNDSSFLQRNLLNTVKLKIQSDQLDEFDGSMYRISSIAIASSLEDIKEQKNPLFHLSKVREEPLFLQRGMTYYLKGDLEWKTYMKCSDFIRKKVEA